MFIFVDVNGLFYPGYMDIALSVLAFLFTIVGIIGCIVPALPGVVLSYAGLLCAYFTSYSHMSASALWIWLAITVAVSVADYFLPAWMTRRFGGRHRGHGRRIRRIFHLPAHRHHPGAVRRRRGGGIAQ